tara:strand:- start:965 stop:1198 length:234 start_codon:yes stop_codon:yes gene_type:complete
MKMNKEEYSKLLKRFALEISEVGATIDIVELVNSQIDSKPNLVSASAESVTDRFVYRHNGYMVEAERRVKLVVKVCK